MYLKKVILVEMCGYCSMMFLDYGVIVGGKEGNMIFRFVCGMKMIKMMVSKSVIFGLEFEVVKVFIDEYFE